MKHRDTKTDRRTNPFKPKQGMLVLLMLVMCALAPVIYLFAQNAEVVSVSEASAIALYYVAGIVAVTVLTLPFTRSINKSGLLSCLIFILFSSFSLMQNGIAQIASGAKYWHVAAVIIYLILIIGWILYRKVKENTCTVIIKLVSLLLSVIFIMNTVIAVPKIVKANAVSRTVVTEDAIDTREGKLPNVYFLLFDEAASFNMIRTFYQYDPQWFIDWMESKGFCVSQNSYNASINTRTITANVLNLDYVADFELMSASEMNELAYNGILFPLLRSKDYHITAIGYYAEYLYGLPSSVRTGKTGALTVGGERFEDILLKTTALQPFRVFPVTDSMQEILDETGFFLDDANLQESQQFYLLHTLFPHSPLLFDENGRSRDEKDAMNYQDRSFYLGQYIYYLKRSQMMLECILQNDPDSVIIFCSDHGSRLFCLPENGFLTEASFNMISNIVHCVYYRGESAEEFRDQSLVNTIRLVLNRLLGMDYEVLDVPHEAEASYWAQWLSESQ